jgi:hypothetical protein
MESFRTVLSIPSNRHKISLSDQILTIGSCFSDAIGEQLVSSKINTWVNPFGIQYNPHSIHKALSYALSRQPVPENTFVNRNEIFFNYDFHSNLSSTDLTELQRRIDKLLGDTNSFIENTQWIFLTYGTALTYERIDTRDTVSNCHKMPQSLFSKHLMTQKKILESFGEMYEQLKIVNPNIRVILTVSPVRHLKETLQLNSVSKSILRVACQTITEQHEDVSYFPSYEIMMDDLRDYRFYKADMIHPNEVAEKYIWEKFSEAYFNDALKSFLIKWAEIKSALSHKPFHPSSSEYQNFVHSTIKKLEELKSIVNVDEEIANMTSKLKNT